MKEICIIKPSVRVGERDWDLVPDLLFVQAYAMVLKARRGPFERAGLEMVMAMKQKEAEVMALMMQVRHEEEFLEEVTDVEKEFARTRLEANRQKLAVLEVQRIVQLQRFAKIREDSPEICRTYEKADVDFSQLLDTLIPDLEKPEIALATSAMADLLLLLDFYLRVS